MFISVDEIRKFVVCFSIDIMEKQPISFQHRLCMLDSSPVELLHMKNNKSMLQPHHASIVKYLACS